MLQIGAFQSLQTLQACYQAVIICVASEVSLHFVIPLPLPLSRYLTLVDRR